MFWINLHPIKLVFKGPDWVCVVGGVPFKDCEFAYCYLLLLVSAFVHAYSMEPAGKTCCVGDKQ